MTSEMLQRWLNKVQPAIPHFDFEDLTAARAPLHLKFNRQNMPEIAQDVYQTTLGKEIAIGNYVGMPNNSVKVTEEVRLYMITVIVEVHRLKNYKEETLYLACSLADRYLALLTVLEQPSPCLIRLAFVCTLMAAKL